MWTVLVNPLVYSEDLKRVEPPALGQILSALRKRLTLDPKTYGKPLRGELAGLWRLRVGDYRVIYRIVESRVEVLVLKVGIHRDFEVYRELAWRLRRT